MSGIKGHASQVGPPEGSPSPLDCSVSQNIGGRIGARDPIKRRKDSLMNEHEAACSKTNIDHAIEGTHSSPIIQRNF